MADIDDSEDCWKCGGDGGYVSCQEDCCPIEGGEDACTDPVCWVYCDACRGKGALTCDGGANA